MNSLEAIVVEATGGSPAESYSDQYLSAFMNRSLLMQTDLENKMFEGLRSARSFEMGFLGQTVGKGSIPIVLSAFVAIELKVCLLFLISKRAICESTLRILRSQRTFKFFQQFDSKYLPPKPI